MKVGKIIFLCKWVIFMFHVNFPGCTYRVSHGFTCLNCLNRTVNMINCDQETYVDVIVFGGILECPRKLVKG